MVLNDLFIVDGSDMVNGMLTATLRVRFPHPIFEGHFPGRPVVPGVCLVQLVQELAAMVAGGEVRMIRAGQVKFISMIEPSVDGSIRMTVTGKEGPAGEWNLVAEGFSAGSVFFRLKGTFRAGSDYAV